jgi:hypothetical protein
VSDLPPSQYLHLGKVARRYAVPACNIKARVARGEFPEPIRDQWNRRRWPVTALDAFDRGEVQS